MKGEKQKQKQKEKQKRKEKKRERGGGGGGDGKETEPCSNIEPSSLHYTHSDPLFTTSSSSTPVIAAVDDPSDKDTNNKRHSSSSFSDRNPTSTESSPINMSPWSNSHSHTTTTTATTNNHSAPPAADLFPTGTGLVGSLVREEGHIYSLAAASGLLFTGSDSKNIRVWRHQKEFSGFKSSSGLVKAIVISGGRVFTGHQDGKIRVWRQSPKDPKVHKRVGTLPTLKDLIKMSINPRNYVQPRRRKGRHAAAKFRHSDAVSCLSMDEAHGLLYTGSWDRTFKVWRVADSKCLESVQAHEDTVNAVVVVALEGLVFTGSADGTVKMWRKEMTAPEKRTTRHELQGTVLRQDSAVTALAVGPGALAVYAGSSDGVVNFWERDGGRMVHGGELRGHRQAVLCVAAAGAMVFSGSADSTICVWRREGAVHACVSVLTGHAGPVKCLAVEPDVEAPGGATIWVLYSGSLDKSVKVWKVAEQLPMTTELTGGERSGQPLFDTY